MNNLATLYENGQGVKRSQVEALRLYRQAGEAGNGVALANAARMLEYGNGVPKNEAEADAPAKDASGEGDNGDEQGGRGRSRNRNRQSYPTSSFTG